MNNAFLVLLLCIGTTVAYILFPIGKREPGDRPIYINTIETNKTEEYASHHVYHEWIGVNERFSLVYVELPVGVTFDLAQISYNPYYKTFFQLQVAGNTTQLLVNVIVYGFVNQTPINFEANIKSEIREVERKVNHLTKL